MQLSEAKGIPASAKDFFHQAEASERRLKLLQARLRHYEQIGLSLSPSSGGLPGGHRASSKVETAAVGAIDAARDLHAQISALMAIHNLAQRVIDKIPQEKYRQILTYKYLCGWSFRSISDELAYKDQNSVYRAHGWALQEAQKVLTEMRG
jgi:DNA-binding transcriptional MerR regulator